MTHRIFTLVLPWAMHGVNDPYESIISAGARLVKRKMIEAVPSELIKQLLKAAGVESQGLVNRIVGNKIEVSIWEMFTSPIEILEHNHLVEEIRSLSESSNVLFAKSKKDVEMYGGIFFWKDEGREDVFISSNKKVKDSLYLPTQLAKDGHGIFYEDRIIDRLMQLGLIPQSAIVLRIEDLGGWESVNRLTARIHVEWIQAEGTALLEAELIATALFPIPPVSPEALGRQLSQCSEFLRKLGILTPLLGAENGVVYSKKLAYNLAEYFSENKSAEVVPVLEEAAYIAAIVDVGWNDENFIPHSDSSLSTINDVFHVGKVADVNRMLEKPSIVDLLGTDGKRVYWTDLNRNLRNIRGAGSALKTLEQISPIELPGLFDAIHMWIFNRCQQGEHPDEKWLAALRKDLAS